MKDTDIATPEMIQGAIRYIEYTYQTLLDSVKELLQIYCSGRKYDLYEDDTFAKLSEDRIPVFVCWYQGFDSAPAIVGLCLDSLYKNLDRDLFEIVPITSDNMADYVRFPAWIREKSDSGIITPTQLSDILRMALLYKYGGVWIDATYYVAGHLLPEDLGKRSFYTVHFNWEAPHISEGRWTQNFLYTAKAHRLPGFVLNAFYLYYLKNEKSADYFMIDYFIRMAYENLPDIKEEIDAIPLSQPDIFWVSDNGNRAYDENEWERICRETSLFKLSYKKDVSPETPDGRETLYGHLLSHSPLNRGKVFRIK